LSQSRPFSLILLDVICRIFHFWSIWYWSISYFIIRLIWQLVLQSVGRSFSCRAVRRDAVFHGPYTKIPRGGYRMWTTGAHTRRAIIILLLWPSGCYKKLASF
jgi:hypothetical protein